jgi:hypothetical protein
MENWTPDIELICNKIRINSQKLAEHHRQTYLDLKNKIKYFKIPIIILSGLNSIFSVGLNSFVPQSVVSVLNCLISLICSIVCSIELFLQIQARMDSSNSNAKDFYILSVDIFKTLSLDRPNRKCEGHAYMEESYALYTKYKSGSALLSTHIQDELEDIPINKDKEVYSNKVITLTNADHCSIDLEPEIIKPVIDVGDKDIEIV